MAQRSSHNNFASKGRAAPRGPGPRFGGLEYQALEPITGSSRATKRRVGRSRGSRGARRPRAAVTHEQRPPWTSRRRARTQGPARLAPRRRLGPPTRTRVVYIPPKPTAPHRWTPRAPASDNRAARAASATAASVRRRGLQESNPLNQSFVITLAWSVFDPVNSRLADGEQGRPIEMAQFSEGHTRPRLDRSAPFFRVGPLSAALLTVPPGPATRGGRKYANSHRGVWASRAPGPGRRS